TVRYDEHVARVAPCAAENPMSSARRFVPDPFADVARHVVSAGMPDGARAADRCWPLPAEVAQWDDRRRERRSDFDGRQCRASPVKYRGEGLRFRSAVRDRFIPADAAHRIVRLT